MVGVRCPPPVQFRAAYGTHTKSKRWYLCIFYYCLDLAIANAFALFRLAHPRPARKRGFTQLDFRMDLVEQLLVAAGRLRTEARQVPLPSDSIRIGTPPPRAQNLRGPYRRVGDPLPPERHQGQHWPDRLPASSRHSCDMCGAGRATVVCSCGFYLCLKHDRNCWRVFHDPAADLTGFVGAVQTGSV